MRTFAILSLSLLSLGTPLGAQDRSPPPREPKRIELEQRFRERNEEMLRERLKLNDDQMKQLRALDARFAPRRADLFKEFRSTQEELQKELERADAADQKRVAQLMQQNSAIRKRLITLLEEEQKALGTFLSPVQTAQYISLQRQLREQVRQKLDHAPKRPEGRPRPDGERGPARDRKGGLERPNRPQNP
jgi:hypothetical protein